MLKNKPYFTLRIESKGASFQARLNGFLVYPDYDQTSVMTEFPVNHVFLNGKNTLSLVIFPVEENGGYGDSDVSLTLYIQTKGESDTTRKIVGQVAYSAAEEKSGGTGISLSMPAMSLDSNSSFEKSKNGDIKVSSAEMRPAKIRPNDSKEVTQDIYIDANFPRWKYLDADQLDFPLSFQAYVDEMDKYDNNVIRPLYEFNLKIYQLFKNKDIEKIVDLMGERNAEMDKALYLPKGTYDDILRKELTSDFKTKKAFISDFDKATPTISDDKKLFKIGLQGMIYLTDEEETVFSSYDMWFYHKDGKWHVSR